MQGDGFDEEKEGSGLGGWHGSTWAQQTGHPVSPSWLRHTQEIDHVLMQSPGIKGFGQSLLAPTPRANSLTSLV